MAYDGYPLELASGTFAETLLLSWLVTRYMKLIINLICFDVQRSWAHAQVRRAYPEFVSELDMLTPEDVIWDQPWRNAEITIATIILRLHPIFQYINITSTLIHKKITMKGQTLIPADHGCALRQGFAAFLLLTPLLFSIFSGILENRMRGERGGGFK